MILGGEGASEQRWFANMPDFSNNREFDPNDSELCMSCESFLIRTTKICGDWRKTEVFANFCPHVEKGSLRIKTTRLSFHFFKHNYKEETK